MADDTYGTVGLTGPASVSEIPDAADPTLVEDPEQDLAPFFLTDGATELLSNMVVGSSWFVLNDAGNARPDSDLKVMIMQITTAGTLSGLINVQLFPNGLGENAQVLTFPLTDLAPSLPLEKPTRVGAQVRTPSTLTLTPNTTMGRVSLMSQGARTAKRATLWTTPPPTMGHVSTTTPWAHAAAPARRRRQRWPLRRHRPLRGCLRRVWGVQRSW